MVVYASCLLQQLSIGWSLFSGLSIHDQPRYIYATTVAYLTKQKLTKSKGLCINEPRLNYLIWGIWLSQIYLQKILQDLTFVQKSFYLKVSHY